MDKTQLRQIVNDQHEEFTELQTRAKPREQTPKLKHLLAQSKLVKVVLGIRRCGKSTLCHQALQGNEVVYVNFDDERLIGLTGADLQKVIDVANELNPQTKTFYFDEIQNIQSWELFVNRLQRKGYNLLISGGNGKLLGKDLATHLTGRHLSLSLYPLSFPEFVAWKGELGLDSNSQRWTSTQRAQLNRYFGEYFTTGGFPEVVLGEPQGMYLRELFDKIIGRDIVQRYRIREVKLLKEVASYLLQNSAQFISYETIKKAFQLSSIQTTRKYVQLLQDVFLVHELKGYSYKLKERSTSRRKTYACDLGMMQALWTKATPDLGAKLETLVFLQLLAAQEEFYYLNEDSREVDFLLLRNGKPDQLLQVCYDLSDAKTRDRELRALSDLGTKYGVDTLSIITRDGDEDVKLGNQQIKIIPAYQYLMDAR